MDIETRNAVITYTHLGYEDHGILTAYIGLEYGSKRGNEFKSDHSGQAFGGYGLDTYSPEKGERVAHKVCGFFIQRVLETVGVDNWEELKGKYIKVKSEHSKVHAIGNILEDKWFEPGKELKELGE